MTENVWYLFSEAAESLHLIINQTQIWSVLLLQFKSFITEVLKEKQDLIRDSCNETLCCLDGNQCKHWRMIWKMISKFRVIGLKHLNTLFLSFNISRKSQDKRNRNCRFELRSGGSGRVQTNAAACGLFIWLKRRSVSEEHVGWTTVTLPTFREKHFLLQQQWKKNLFKPQNLQSGLSRVQDLLCFRSLCFLAKTWVTTSAFLRWFKYWSEWMRATSDLCSSVEDYWVYLSAHVKRPGPVLCTQKPLRTDLHLLLISLDYSEQRERSVKTIIKFRQMSGGLVLRRVHCPALRLKRKTKISPFICSQMVIHTSFYIKKI